MPTNAGTAFVQIKGDFGPFRAGLRRAESSYDSQVRGMGKRLSSTLKVAAKVGGAALAAGAVVGAKKSVDAAVNLGEQINKTKVVFRGAEKQVLDFGKTSARSLGISNRAALEAAGTFGNMLVPMGIARKEAGHMSVEMVKLAGDMASFNNASPEETLHAIRSGLSGESEPLRKFGVDLREAALQEFALSKGIKETVKDMTNAEKAQLAYKKIINDTGDAQGDFARTSDSLANKQRVLKAQLEDIGASLGTALLPALQKGASALSDFANDVSKILNRRDLTAGEKFDRIGNEIAQRLEKAIPVIAEAAARIGPKIAASMLKGFFHAPPLVQLLTGAWVIAKSRKLLGAFGLLGRASGTAFSTGMATTVAGGTGAGAAGGAAGGLAGFGSKLAKFAKVGVGVATGAAILEGIRLRLNKPDTGLQERLKQLQAPGVLGVRSTVATLQRKIPFAGGGKDDFAAQIDNSKKLQGVLGQINAASSARVPVLQRQAAELADQLKLTQSQKDELSSIFRLKATAGVSHALGGITQSSRDAQAALPAVVAAQKRVNELQRQGKTDTHAYTVAVRALDAAEATRSAALNARAAQQFKALSATKADLSAARQTLVNDRRLGASKEQLQKDMIQVAQAASRQQAALANVSRALRGLTPITGAAGTKMGALLKQVQGFKGGTEFKKFLITADLSSVEKGIGMVTKLQGLGRIKTALKIFADSKTSEEALRRLKRLLGDLEDREHKIRLEAEDLATRRVQRLKRHIDDLPERKTLTIEASAKLTRDTRRLLNFAGQGQAAKSLLFGGGAKGGVVGKSKNLPTSLAVVGEEGPELVSLPIGSRVHANPESQRMAKRMGIKGFARGGTVKASGRRESNERLRDEMERIWAVADSLFKADGEPMPRIRFPKHSKMYAWVQGSRNDVAYGPAARREFQRGESYAEKTLLHEWAHIFQRPGMAKWETEGGAEAFAQATSQDVFAKAKVKHGPAPIAYLPWYKRVNRERGRSWVLRGQFGFGDTSKGPRPDLPKGPTGPGGIGGPKDHKNLGRAASGLTPAARYLASTMRQKFGLAVSPQGGVRPGDSGSFHSVGKAVDLVGSKMRAGAEWVKTSGLYKTLLEGIHNPNLSTDSGKMVSSGFWGGSTWAGHKDHVHLAANTITKQAKEGLTKGTGGPKEAKLRHKGKFNLGQMVTLAKRAGFPDPALAAAIGYAESGGNTAAHNKTAIEDSRGLWQVNVKENANPKYKDWDLSDAFRNAKAALEISKGGKYWKPWTMFTNGQYKRYLGAKGKPLPKGTSTGTPTGSKYTDYLAMRLLEAESNTPSDPKDDIRWINRAMRYWRGVRKRNRAAGNWARVNEALGELNSLKTKKKELRAGTEDEDLFTLGGLEKIGKDANAFPLKVYGDQLANLELAKANASLTVPADTDDSLPALKASLQDDIAAATKIATIWEGLKSLADGFFVSSPEKGQPFKPSKAQKRALDKTKNPTERTNLLNRFISERDRGTFIQGTLAQKTEATTNLGTAKSELRSLLAEINKTPEAEEAAASSNAKEEIRAFLAAIGDLNKTFGSNFKPLQSFADGGIIQGPRGKKVVIEGHGGEAIINEDGNLTVTIDPKQLKEVLSQSKVENKYIDARPTFIGTTPEPHTWSKSVLHELEAG